MSTNFPSDSWHPRFLQQAQWTQPLRDHFLQIFKEVKFTQILEVGCGTGAVMEYFRDSAMHAPIGIDIDLKILRTSPSRAMMHRTAASDGIALPFAENSFDLVYCHFLLLWTKDPARILSEMYRVSRPWGIVAAFAEPDYGGRIDPAQLAELLKNLQIRLLKHQGADPFVGRKLPNLFHNVGFQYVQAGILGAEWKLETQKSNLSYDIDVLKYDIMQTNDPAYNEDLAAIEQRLKKDPDGFSFVPTWYAWGFKKE